MVKKMGWIFDGRTFTAILLTLPGQIIQYDPEEISNDNSKPRKKRKTKWQSS